MMIKRICPGWSTHIGVPKEMGRKPNPAQPFHFIAVLFYNFSVLCLSKYGHNFPFYSLKDC